MSARLYKTTASGYRQRGAVLFVSLMILIVLSLLAIVTVNTSLSETKMVSGMRNMQLAQLAADSALHEAEVKISSLVVAYGAGQVCTHIACAIRDASAPVDAPAFMQTAVAKAAMIPFRIDFTKFSGIDESAHLALSPSYVIEDLGISKPTAESSATATIRPSHNFRITVSGVGGTGSFVRVIESVYSIPDPNTSP